MFRFTTNFTIKSWPKNPFGFKHLYMKKISLPFLFSSILLFAITGCKKEYDSIGLNFQDNLLGATFTDTATLVAFSIREDSIVTSTSASYPMANTVLGQIQDPVFGMTKSNIYTQFDLSGQQVSFGTNARLDSIVLTMQISGYFGDTNQRMSIEVYELDELLSLSQLYYSHQTSAVKPENLTYAPFSFYPKPTTKVILNQDTAIYDPHVRIRLSQELGERFLLNSGQMNNNTNFINFFNGLHITAVSQSAPGCLLYVNLTSSVSGINLYYTNDDGRKRFTFVTKSKQTPFYTHFDHDYTTSTDWNFKEQVVNGNKEIGKQVLFSQPMAGVKTVIQFPHIGNWKESNVAVNQAELVISNVSENELYFFQPYTLALGEIVDKGSVALMDDPQYSNVNTSKYFGGTYDAEKKEYRFRITKHVQKLINQGNGGKGIYLMVSGASIRANRLIMSGTEPAAPDKRLRLELYYTSY